MALSEVNFITLNGGLGRDLAGDDSTSALVVVDAAATDLDVLQVSSYQEVLDAGVAADSATAYYARTFFAKVSAILFIRPSTGDFAADLEAIQNAADGAVKQVAVVAETFAVADMTELQSALGAQAALKRGMQAIYAAASLGSFTVSTLPSLATQTCPGVTALVSGDEASNFPAAGALLGTVAAANVAECVAWVQKFRVDSGSDFAEPAFADGTPLRSVTQATLNALHTKRYVFLRTYTGRAGVYFSSSATAVASTDDFATIENNRVIEKARRALRAALLPELNSPLKLAGGKLRPETVAKFDLLCRNRLEQMQNNDELSEFAIYIDPAQNVLASSTLELQAMIVPVGVASSITVKIGFSTSL